MPELPEVETIKNQLLPKVLDKTIATVKLNLARMLEGGVSAFKKNLPGQKVESVFRRGKYVIFLLSQDTLVFHLGMTGQMFADKKSVRPLGLQNLLSTDVSLRHPSTHTSTPLSAGLRVPSQTDKPTFVKKTITGYQIPQGGLPLDKHVHLILNFTNGSELRFRDTRTFGKIIYHKGHNWKSIPRIAKLGPEPLEINSVSFLKKNFPFTSKRDIKTFLLDQSFMAGIGNIYVDESLFESKLHPQSNAANINLEKWKKLLDNIKKVLRKGIKNSGTTFSDYRAPDGSKGKNQEKLKVYGRAGNFCYRCKTVLVKTVVGQRGTVFCPNCQRA